ncbi:HAD family hydrolase [Glutamicibacter sp. JL.03c]|uniref:HAD family hydrolase n=1 Tax=Glutamicibacter sp. JL.03c TaxID=2984842 RepID=UPI0021F6FEDF|nr:HAD family hydrolase [Glutamicibacter sp. JL.03c]UYQ79013.1 HAD family hydrolase [Glutamicibacter sp. JL.03c]
MPSTSFDFNSGSAPSTPHAVLWDMDGTLIDTEPYWIVAEAELVAAHGGTWTEEQGLSLVGSALPNSAKILQEAGVNLPAREIIELLSSQVVAGLRKEIPWRPGARELLAACHAAGIPQALVTMSERSIVKELMDQLPQGTFQASVTGEEVSLGKPHPEPYLTGLRLLQEASGKELSAEKCIGFEDSVPGIASASAAGLHAVLVPNATDPGDGKWRRIDSLDGVDVEEMTRWLVQVSA